MTRRACLVLLLPLVAWSCGRPGRPAAAWRLDGFVVAARGAPPPRPEAYRKAAAAGIRVLGDQAGPEALEAARAAGVRLVVGRVGLDPSVLRNKEERERVARTLAGLRRERAVWGYLITKPASEPELEGIGLVADFVRRHDPDHPLLVPLVPCEAFVGPSLETPHYARYLEKFFAAVKPAVLYVIHLPFRRLGPPPLYFENLELIRKASLSRGVPFLVTIRCAEMPGMEAVSEARLRWLANTALAYGARGIVWLGYYGRGAMVTPEGFETKAYRWVATLNRNLQALGGQLFGLTPTAVYHVGQVPSGATRLPTHGLLGGIEGGEFVVGMFRDRQGRDYCLIVNKSHERSVVARVTINVPCRSVECYDPQTRRWEPMAAVADRFQTRLEIPLPPGGARLVRPTPG